MLLLLIINLLLLLTLSSSYIELDVYENYGTYDLLVRIGLHSYWKMLELGMDMEFLYICVHDLNPKDPEIHFTNEIVNINISNTALNLEKVYSSLYFNKQGNIDYIFTTNNNNNVNVSYGFNIPHIPLLYSKIALVSTFDTFPLAHTYTNTSLSIIHLLKHNKHISKLSFALYCHYKAHKGKLYLGGLPTTILHAFPYSASVPVGNNINYWGTTLTSVIVNDNNIYTVNNNVRFSYTERHIRVPMEFIEWMKLHVFNRYIADGKCRYNNWYPEKRFTCDELVNDFPNITFNFQGIEIVFHKEILFKKQYEQSYEFEIYGNDKLTTQNEWILGNGFLTYKLLEFNYETNHITFYSNELTKGMNIHTITTNTITTLNNIKRILIFNIIYISIYTLFLFIKYININKESSTKN